MILVYTLQDDYLMASGALPGAELPSNTVWIDLFHPTHEEDVQVETWTKADYTRLTRT